MSLAQRLRCARDAAAGVAHLHDLGDADLTLTLTLHAIFVVEKGFATWAARN